MTKRAHVGLFVLVLLTCCLTPLTAAAQSITYTESFNAAGTVNGTPFDGSVMFSLTSDVSQVFGNCDGVAGIFCTPNSVASVSIQGIGAGTFNDLFYVFDNQNGAVAGFSDIAIEDIVDLSNSAFATYDLKSSIGPLQTTYFFTDDGVELGSSLGNIVFDSFGGTPTFQASEGGGTTPEPGSLILFGSGVVGLAVKLRRRARV